MKENRDINNSLKEIKLLISLDTLSPIFELPSNGSTMSEAGHIIDGYTLQVAFYYSITQYEKKS